VAAWAVNQVARERRAEVEALLALDDRLGEAQPKALGAGGAKEL